jgi:nucleotide-binding universal stress UspA family protein
MQQLLLPCDDSANALLAAREAIKEFRLDPALRIHLLNVQTPFPAHIANHLGREDRSEFHQEHARAALAPVLREFDAAEVPYTLHIEVGDKVECILAAVQRLGCERILLATDRKSPLVRAIENSLTSRLIEHAPVPVEVIAGAPASALERVGVPAGVAAGLTLLWVSAS